MARHPTLIGFSALMFSCVLPGVARAQSFNDFLDKKYEIQQQQADSDRARAEADRLRAEAEARATAAQANRLSTAASATSSGTTHYTVPHDTNDFAGKKVPTYSLPNGVSLQATGEFHPNKDARCTSECFVPLNASH